MPRADEVTVLDLVMCLSFPVCAGRAGFTGFRIPGVGMGIEHLVDMRPIH